MYCNSSSATIHHKGKHKHARPSEKVSKESLARLENMVKINMNAKPIQILQGMPTREAAAENHPGLNNLDRLAYYMKNFKKETILIATDRFVSVGGNYGC